MNVAVYFALEQYRTDPNRNIPGMILKQYKRALPYTTPSNSLPQETSPHRLSKKKKRTAAHLCSQKTKHKGIATRARCESVEQAFLTVCIDWFKPRTVGSIRAHRVKFRGQHDHAIAKTHTKLLTKWRVQRSWCDKMARGIDYIKKYGYVLYIPCTR